MAPAGVVDHYKSVGWQHTVVRGVMLFTPGDRERTANRYWPNVDLITDAMYYQISQEPRTRIKSRYRLFICPPALVFG
jgi:hypothetical protein